MLKLRNSSFINELNRLRNEWTPNSIHDMRVACRRLRTALRVFSPNLNLEISESLDKWLKKFMRAFNELRDTDVQGELIGTIKKRVPVLVRGKFGCMEGFLKRKKKKLDASLKKRVRTLSETSELPVPLPEFTCTDKTPFGKTALKTLEKELLEAVNRYKMVPWGSPENSASFLHSLRIQIKRLRYGIELYQEYLGVEIKDFLAKLKTVQDLLGNIHDCDVFAGVLGTLFERREAGRHETALRILQQRRWPSPDPKAWKKLPLAEQTDDRPVILFSIQKLAQARQEKFLQVESVLNHFFELECEQSILEWFRTGKCPELWKNYFLCARRDQQMRQK